MRLRRGLRLAKAMFSSYYGKAKVLLIVTNRRYY